MSQMTSTLCQKSKLLEFGKSSSRKFDLKAISNRNTPLQYPPCSSFVKKIPVIDFSKNLPRSNTKNDENLRESLYPLKYEKFTMPG